MRKLLSNWHVIEIKFGKNRKILTFVYPKGSKRLTSLTFQNDMIILRHGFSITKSVVLTLREYIKK